MKPKYLAVLVAALLVAGGLLLSHRDNVPVQKYDFTGEVSVTTPEGTEKDLNKEQPVPDFFIKRGEDILTLGDLRGRYIFINFWNTWCPPCKEEMPDLNRLYLENNKRVEFLFINITAQEKSVQAVADFLKENKLELPVYLDKDAGVAYAYGIRSIPTTIVVNPGGEVVYARPGLITYEEAKSLIK